MSRRKAVGFSDKNLKEMRRLKNANNGILEPTKVWISVRDNKRSPLRDLPCWVWDKDEAFEKINTEAARGLISSFTMLVYEETKVYEAPVFVKDPRTPNKQGYVELADVRGDKERSQQIIAHEFEMAASYLQRARNVAAALDMENEVAEIQAKLDTLIERVALLRDHRPESRH